MLPGHISVYSVDQRERDKHILSIKKWFVTLSIELQYQLHVTYLCKRYKNVMLYINYTAEYLYKFTCDFPPYLYLQFKYQSYLFNYISIRYLSVHVPSWVSNCQLSSPISPRWALIVATFWFTNSFPLNEMLKTCSILLRFLCAKNFRIESHGRKPILQGVPENVYEYGWRAVKKARQVQTLLKIQIQLQTS